MKSFREFVFEQDAEKGINNRGWDTCAVGEYYTAIGAEVPELIGYHGCIDPGAGQVSPPELADVPPEIMHELDWRDVQTYGQLQDMFLELEGKVSV